MSEASKMPARIWARNDHPQFFADREEFNSTLYIRADIAEQMAGALRFYSGLHESGLSNPNEGACGVNSTDFGERARAALSAWEASNG